MNRTLNRFSDTQRIVRAIAEEFLDGSTVRQMQVLPYEKSKSPGRIKVIEYGMWTLRLDRVNGVIHYQKRSV